MKTIQVHYYALLREERGLSQETIQTQAATASDLYAELQQKHRFRLPIEVLRVAINNEFREWGTFLQTGDSVVFIPPVSGG